jgi:hypothetical protein
MPGEGIHLGADDVVEISYMSQVGFTQILCDRGARCVLRRSSMETTTDTELIVGLV